MAWSRERFEEWLQSQSVKRHLLLWYHLCVKSPKRFNEAVEWINTGENGYFYNSSDLEEDLLLMCLDEGNIEDQQELEEDKASYADQKTLTHKWSTQEVWARAAWRIVQDNRGAGEAFEHAAINHAAAAYGFVIEILCIAFHSMAFRKWASVWEEIITGIGFTMLSSPDTPSAEDDKMVDVVMRDQGQGEETEDDAGDDDADKMSIATSERSTWIISDSDFEEPVTPNAKRSSHDSSPKAPRRGPAMQEPISDGEERIRDWMSSMSPTDGMGPAG